MLFPQYFHRSLVCKINQGRIAVIIFAIFTAGSRVARHPNKAVVTYNAVIVLHKPCGYNLIKHLIIKAKAVLLPRLSG